MLSSLVVLAASEVVASKPNIVWFLTDDQDQMLGASFPPLNGSTPMPKTQALLADKGFTATNFFIHTPICCPSRSELLSGRYLHNIKRTGAPACMHVDETVVNNNTFARYLNQAGYTVGMFGKYLNTVPNFVPQGFDAWLANGGGDYFSPSFSTHGIHFGGYNLPNGKWKGTKDNYTTAVVGNLSVAWIKSVVKADASRPFFAYVAPKAAHEPFNPAPWYTEHWDKSWPAHEPRPPNWNCSAESRADHHGNIATQSMLTAESAAVITDVYKNRWRTLMSVDDVIGAVIGICEELGVAENTYFFYSSDHGFQLGEFNIIMDKRHVYDWNTRIHLLGRGPGIKAGSTFELPATQVDMAPTFLGLAGLSKPSGQSDPAMDGHSLVPLIVDGGKGVVPGVLHSTVAHLAAMGDAGEYRAGWRDSVFIEYYYVADNVKCVGNCTVGDADDDENNEGGYPNRDSSCGDLTTGHNAQCWAGSCNTQCYPTENTANNFIGVRHMPSSAFGDTLYAEFQTGNQGNAEVNFKAVDFTEYYNASSDTWMMNNLAKSAPKETISALHEKLQQWFMCSGDSCP